MEEAIKDIEDSFFFYNVDRCEEDERKTKIFFIYDNQSAQTRHIENTLYEHIKESTQSFELVTMGFQDSMSHFTIHDWRKTNRQLFEGYDLFCSEKTNEYFAQQYYLYTQKMKENIKEEFQFKTFVLHTILEAVLEKTISYSTSHNIILVVMMNSIEALGLREFHPNHKSKVILIDTGDLNINKKLNFATDLFKKYSTDPSCAYFYEQIMPSRLEKNDENFTRYLDIVSQKIISELKFTQPTKCGNKYLQYPWSQPSNIVNCGSIVLSKANYGNTKSLTNVHVKRQETLDYEQLCNLFSTWTNLAIQLRSQNSITDDNINELIKYLEQFSNSLPKRFHTQENVKQKDEKISIKDRLLMKQRRNTESQVQLLMRSLKDLISENILDKLDDEQFLERQKIGTIVGKFHQRAVKMQGLDVNTFLQIKEGFAQRLKQIQKDINPDSDEERSIMTLENFKDMLLQEDIFDALNLIKNQYQLISSFPLIGLGVSIKRSNGSMINPYLVKVTDFARVNQYVDTISIQNTPDKELILNAGYHDDSITKTCIKEKIDAVVPLFGLKDYDLKPLLQSKFFHLLVTFNVMNNADTIYDQAYFALLANTLIYLLNEEKSKFIEDLLDKIYHSVNIVYSDKKFFQEYCKMLISNPRLAMVTYHEGHPTQCQGPSQALLSLFYLQKRGELTDKVLIKEILEAIMQEIVARGIKDTSKMISHFDIVGFDRSQFKHLVEKIVNTFAIKATSYPTVRQLMHEVEKKLKEEDTFKVDRSCRLTLNKKKFTYLSFGKYNFFVSLKNICEYFLPGEKFKGELLWFWLFHISKYNNNYVRNSTPINTDIKKVYRYFKAQKIQLFMTDKFEKVMNICQKKLAVEFEIQMIQRHIRVIPTTRADLIKKIKAANDANITFNNVSNLTRSYCLCPDCPFYLVKLPNLSEHIKDVNCYIPGFNKTIRSLKREEPAYILEAIQDGALLSRDNEKSFILAYNRIKSEHIVSLILNNIGDFLDAIEEIANHYKRL